MHGRGSPWISAAQVARYLDLLLTDPKSAPRVQLYLLALVHVGTMYKNLLLLRAAEQLSSRGAGRLPAVAAARAGAPAVAEPPRPRAAIPE